MVYIEGVGHCSRAQLMPITQRKIPEGSTIHTDGKDKPIFAYDGLVLNRYNHYTCMIKYGKNLERC